MITNYFRPQNLPEALHLLKQPDTRPLGGGNWLNQVREETFAVVDLQALCLNHITTMGNNLEIGACVTLQQLMEISNCPTPIKQAILLEAGLNIRSAATVAGSLVSGDGRSAFTAVMLALDAKMILSLDDLSSVTTSLGDFIPLRPRVLITAITIPLNVKSAFETVARSPLDKPIICTVVSQWPGGRTRLVVGGFQNAPILAMDGTEPEGLESAARNACHESGDVWASREYRSETAAALARRCLAAIN